MTPAAILTLVLNYGPQILPLIQEITTWIKAGKTEVTPEDIATLIAFGAKPASQYLADAGGAPKTPAA